jgi:HD-GYP domain-containing protein (c-di-GMP phosphodiesterase class II)
MKGTETFVTMLSLALSNAALYGLDHEMVEGAVRETLSALAAIPGGKIEMMVVDGDLVVNQVPFTEKNIHGAGLVRRFSRKGLSWTEFGAGADAEEVRNFLRQIVGPGAVERSTEHVHIGTLGVRTGGKDEIITDGMEEAVSSGDLDRFKEIYNSASKFGDLEVKGLEEIAAGFVTALRREANILRMISPVKAYSEYTYTHATNVALLAIVQGERIGIGDELLHEVGVAGLMHDVGKLFISKDVLDKKGRLEQEEFEEMMRHPVHGARYLAGMKGLTPLAPLVSFEHHRKFDGTGYPAPRTGDKRQHTCSQIVAIADFFDALRSNRPYRVGWDAERILSLMREEAGQAFSPVLLASFETLIREALGTVGKSTD